MIDFYQYVHRSLGPNSASVEDDIREIQDPYNLIRANLAVLKNKKDLKAETLNFIE